MLKVKIYLFQKLTKVKYMLLFKYHKFSLFLIYFLPQYSSWTLSIVSIDRMFALSMINLRYNYEVNNNSKNSNHTLTKIRQSKIFRYITKRFNLNFNESEYEDNQTFCKALLLPSIKKYSLLKIVNSLRILYMI